MEQSMKAMDFLKGMGAGLVVGACVGMTVLPDHKSRKKQIGRAVKTVGQIIEDVGAAVRF